MIYLDILERYLRMSQRYTARLRLNDYREKFKDIKPKSLIRAVERSEELDISWILICLLSWT
jgi:hypothetical protein